MARLTESLAGAALRKSDKDEPIARWLLPPELAEISGLALTPDGRLFAHNDETARITEIDYRRGTVIKHFSVGRAVTRRLRGPRLRRRTDSFSCRATALCMSSGRGRTESGSTIRRTTPSSARNANSRA